MSDLKDFLSRWSRRKRGATESSTARDRVDVERAAAQVGVGLGESGTLGEFRHRRGGLAFALLVLATFSSPSW